MNQGQFIHDEYRWNDGTFTSSLQSEQIEFQSGAGLVVSQYTSTVAPQGGNLVPANGADVNIISNQIPALGDDFIFDASVNQFRYHRSATLYSSLPADIQTLLNVSTQATPITGGAPTFDASFPMPNTNDEYLYLIWDYRKPTPIELCYSTVSCAEACCECGDDPTDNLKVELCFSPLATTTSAPSAVIAPSSGVSIGSFVNLSSNPSCTYVVVSTTTETTSDTLDGISTETDCNLICDEYLITANGLVNGSVNFTDCGGTIQNVNLNVGTSTTICARTINTLTDTIAAHTCGCGLNVLVGRCQEPNTGVVQEEVIAYGGESVGDYISLTGFTGCKFEVKAITSDPVTATKLGNETSVCCNAYFVENITPSTKTFFYTDCFGIAQNITILTTGVQIVCMRSFTQPQTFFDVTFQTCDCTPI